MACGILVPRPGIESGCSAVKVWSPNHRTTREFPADIVLKKGMSLYSWRLQGKQLRASQVPALDRRVTYSSLWCFLTAPSQPLRDRLHPPRSDSDQPQVAACTWAWVTWLLALNPFCSLTAAPHGNNTLAWSSGSFFCHCGHPPQVSDVEGGGEDFSFKQNWVHIPALSFLSCVASGKWLFFQTSVCSSVKWGL